MVVNIVKRARGASLVPRLWPLLALLLVCAVMYSAEHAEAAVSPLLHNSTNLGTKYGTWGTAFTCTTCHDKNTPTNVKRIAATVQTPTGPKPVVFLRMTASSTAINGVFGDDLRTYALNGSTNICEVCHHNTTHHQYTSAKITDRTTNPHFNRQDCAGSCHPHSAGFKPAGCDGCHGNPPITASIGGGALNGLATPATGATNGATGAHATHVTGKGMLCATCHTGTTMPTVSNSIQMGFAMNGTNWPGFVGNAAFGSFSGHTPLNAPYTGVVSSSAGTTVTNSAGYRNSCNVYCHANWSGSNGSLNPSWVITDGSQKACGTCHGASSATPPTTGSHVRHAGNSATSLAVACANCHGAHPDNSHVDGNVKWNLKGVSTIARYKKSLGNYTTIGSTGALAPSATYGSCTNIYCHSTVQGATGTGGPTTYATPTWGGATLTCGGCHADMSGVSGTGSHTKHANTYKFACSLCHGAGYSSTTVTYPKHVNGYINISSNGNAKGTAYSKGKSIAPGSAVYGTCSNGYCHSNGTGGTLQTGDTRGIVANSSPAWGGTTTCTSCHAAPPNYANYTSNTSITGQKANSHQGTTHAAQTCDVCHSSVSTADGGVTYATYTTHNNGRYNLKASLGYTYGVKGGTCATPGCHGSAKWGGQLGCINCHNVSITRTKGRVGATLAAVTTEFGLAYGHKKTGRGAVTNSDCVVCHLEGYGYGNANAGKPNPTYHQNGNIDLRDPLGSGETAITNISGAAFTFQRFSTSYAAGSRTSTGHQSNTDIANVITQKFCLACHRSGGATNTTARTAGGTAYMPWGGVNLGATYTVANGAAVAGGVVNVFSQFSTANSSYHPVRGPLNRDFPAATRLIAPYNSNGNRAGTSGTKTLSVVLNCFDCHNTSTPLTRRTISAHGNAAMIRGTIYAFGAVSTLCTTCHAGYTVTGTHGSGSAWSATGDTHNVSRNCQDCHGTYQTTSTAPARPIRAQDYHGNNSLNGGGLWPTVNSRPYAFIRAWGGTAYHRPFRAKEFTTGSATCGSGTCPSGGNGGSVADGSTLTYTPGGSY